MPGAFNPNFNPAQVMLGGGGESPAWGAKPPIANPIQGPYLPTKPMPKPGGPPRRIGPEPPVSGGPPRFQPPPSTPQPPGNILGAQPIRATGTGPYDSAYRQDLATYAGGNFLQPQGGMSFNPTAQPGQPGAMGGNPTGGGNAPVQGMPTDLLTAALGGQGFGYAPPPAPPSATTAIQPQDWQKWLQGIMGQTNFQPTGATR